MKIAINQPYFLPYLGYFQLIAAADLFVAYENVAYTKRSWISRNRLQGKAREPYFMSLPTVNATNGTLIRDIHLHDTAPRELAKLIRRIRTDYAKANCFNEVFVEVEEMLKAAPLSTLAAFNNYCLKWICDVLDIKVKLSLENDDLLVFEGVLREKKGHKDFDAKSQRIFGLASHFGANHYLNLAGGRDIYNCNEFMENGLKLSFMEIPNIDYPQFQGSFTPHLSILDTILHCGVSHTRELVHEYKFQ
jgi:hypothetical protein